MSEMLPNVDIVDLQIKELWPPGKNMICFAKSDANHQLFNQIKWETNNKYLTKISKS
jgi:hypothetical protein